MRLVTLALVAALATGCALRPAPITNPSLSTVGRFAVRAAQVVNAVDIGQRQIEPLVKAEVLTAKEGLTLAEWVGTTLEQAKGLVAVLTVADAAQTVAEHSSALRSAQDMVKQLLRTVTGWSTGVGSLGGRIVVDALAGTVTDAVGDLALGGAR